MCDPTGGFLIAGLVLSAAASAASIAQQRQQAKSQEKFQDSLTEASNAGAEATISSLRVSQGQERESAAREGQQAQLAGRSAASTATVAAGEAGVSGNSVQALLADFEMQQGTYQETIQRQQQINDANTDEQARGVATGANYQALSINAPIARPNYVAEVLRFGGTATGYAADVYGRNPSKKALGNTKTSAV